MLRANFAACQLVHTDLHPALGPVERSADALYHVIIDLQACRETDPVQWCNVCPVLARNKYLFFIHAFVWGGVQQMRMRAEQ